LSIIRVRAAKSASTASLAADFGGLHLVEPLFGIGQGELALLVLNRSRDIDFRHGQFGLRDLELRLADGRALLFQRNLESAFSCSNPASALRRSDCFSWIVRRIVIASNSPTMSPAFNRRAVLGDLDDGQLAGVDRSEHQCGAHRPDFAANLDDVGERSTCDLRRRQVRLHATAIDHPGAGGHAGQHDERHERAPDGGALDVPVVSCPLVVTSRPSAPPAAA
jgi:hypothetical protein